MQNRGASFSLDRGRSTRSQPGRQPFHTLNPALAVLSDGRVMAYGTMGGDGQPQTQAALFTRHVLFRQPLEEAIERAALAARPHLGLAAHEFRMEAASTNLIDRLMSAGHDVEVLPRPIPTRWAMPAPWCCRMLCHPHHVAARMRAADLRKSSLALPCQSC